MKVNSLQLIFVVLALLVLPVAACGPGLRNPAEASPPLEEPATPTPSPHANATTSPSPSFTATAFKSDQPLPTSTASATPTPSSTPEPSPSPTPSPTPTLIPTYSILRGEVLQRSNCRYGPGAPYLYKYGLVVGSNLEVIGRNELGTWVLVRAIGGDNPCWVKASLMEIKGDVMSVEPTYIPLPMSPYYGPLSGVNASRQGDQVTISWNPFQLRAGDETASAQYLVETWTCVDGQLLFTPTGTDTTAISVQDEKGCAEPSKARVYGVEKHGYTNWIEVKFPPHP